MYLVGGHSNLELINIQQAEAMLDYLTSPVILWRHDWTSALPVSDI